jgi:hypothetical protein
MRNRNLSAAGLTAPTLFIRVTVTMGSLQQWAQYKLSKFRRHVCIGLYLLQKELVPLLAIRHISVLIRGRGGRLS